MKEGGPIRVAVDIGGTFTDVVAVESGTGHVIRAKADTTPGRLEQGVLDALERSGVPAADVAAFIHGTTVVINALTERRGVDTALVTTRGFRDVLEIGRANRPDLYNLSYVKPVPFVPRHLRFEVTERMSYRGEVLEPMIETDLDNIAGRLAGLGVQAVAVCLLHAWVNPGHERRAVAALGKRLPGVSVIGSHQVSRQWREYERSSTTVLSAYVQPVVSSYLGSLEHALRSAGVRGPLHVMRSNGGICSFERAAGTPISLLESGPVAGVTAAAELGRRLGARHVLALDIGGTTAKTSAVRDGQVRVDSLHHVGKTPVFAGYPVQSPTVEIIEIGAGGGSVAWADEAGGLHVGPRSAGAQPGPACYGRGGAEPTLTDANLVAGRIDPAFFLGGAMTLDEGAAMRALSTLGARLGADGKAVARGVIRYAVAQMSHALRLVTLRRGYDPRDFAFVAYGGAGPLHAALLARELGMTKTIIPQGPGHFSAFGMLAGPLRADAVQTVVGPLDGTDLDAAFARAQDAAIAELGVQAAGQPGLTRYAELRYQGQEHTLEVAIPADTDVAGPAGRAELRSAFDRRCLEAYAFRLDVPLEVVAVRVSAVAPTPAVEWSGGDAAGTAGPASSSRLVDLDIHGGVVRVPVIGRPELAGAGRLAGPCVVEEPAATTLVLPGQAVYRDELGNLVIEEDA
ncbi:MAG TPA: hydantoinase/oxoprolinase family protein [Streptosporangiaceae bacterium]|nr:hydantoinase/oxoprolinase family protein [Streptosporangiaceae bacterium]